MIPRFSPPLGLAEFAAAAHLPGADDVALFEEAFAATMGERHAIAFPYGRTGLVALMRALGLSGHEVICPAYTCVVVPNAVVISGNTPVFIDSGPDANARLDLALARVSRSTGALIATSIFGHPVDLGLLGEIRRQWPEVPVIQDCAHSFICEWQGRAVHREGVAAVFGLNVSKTMTSIFGGMVTTSDDAIAARLRDERARMLVPATLSKSVARALYMLAVAAAFWQPVFGLTDRLRRMGLLDRFTRYYDGEAIDMPADYLAAMTALEARVGLAQTRQLASQIAARRAYDAYYRQHLSDLQGMSWIERSDGSSVSHVAARVADRARVRDAAARRCVELGDVIEYAVPDLPAYRRLLPGQPPCPVAKVLSETTINLPTANSFDELCAARVTAVMREILSAAPPPPPLSVV